MVSLLSHLFEGHAILQVVMEEVKVKNVKVAPAPAIIYRNAYCPAVFAFRVSNLDPRYPFQGLRVEERRRMARKSAEP